MKKVKLEDLQHGDTLVVNVRKVHNRDPKRKHDYKLQIEGAEYVENPFRPLNAAGLFNSTDSRFVGNKPRRGWVTIEADRWEHFFPGTISLADLEKLAFSSNEDDVMPADRKEGVHYRELGILNPQIKVGKLTFGMQVLITESDIRNNEKQNPKVNPAKLGSDGLAETQTADGKPIYVRAAYELCKLDEVTGERKVVASKFLVSDQMKTAAREGRLSIADVFDQEAAAIAQAQAEPIMKKKFDETPA